MLKDLLRHKIPQGPIYPYQYFDLICGTSTGGFAAILLGVLDLEIDDAISTYLNLMKVCEESLRSWWWARDSRKTLTVAIQAILEKHGYKDKLMADDSRKGKCKVGVTNSVLNSKLIISSVLCYDGDTRWGTGTNPPYSII